MGYPAEVGALFTTVSSIRVRLVGLALWLVSGIVKLVPLWIRHPLLHNCL